MYILEPATTRAEIKITKDHSIALLKGHVSTSILLDFPEDSKSLTKSFSELLLLLIDFLF